MISANTSMERETIFISKATPSDDEFVLWLAPRLEAAGYKVFADILTLEPGDRWRKEVTNTLHNNAIKMLLCCQDSSLEKDGVQEEIGIAQDLSKALKDPRFIIPLRLEPYKKVFGIGELQYVDFFAKWASGLADLLAALERQKVPRRECEIAINPNWEAYKNRLAIKVESSPETLTSNWLRMMSVPNVIRYYVPTGALDHTAMQQNCTNFDYPAEVNMRGFFTFADFEEVEREFISAGKFTISREFELIDFLENGAGFPDVSPREARNMISSMFRQAWERFCRGRGFQEYSYAIQSGFHVTEEQVTIGKRIQWGRKGQKRSSMLRNISNNKVWQYGVSASPQFWPFPHFKFKSRVLFAELAGQKAGKIFTDSQQQHRFRRKICKGWRNKQWHGRFMAFLELLADNSCIEVPVSSSSYFRLDANPILVTAPITTLRLDAMPDDGEEEDFSTLGNVDIEED